MWRGLVIVLKHIDSFYCFSGIKIFEINLQFLTKHFKNSELNFELLDSIILSNLFT